VGLKAEDKLEHLQTGVTQLPDGFTAEEATNFIIEHQDESLVLTVLRDGEEKSFIARAKEGIVPGRKAIGLQLGDVGTLQLPPHLALVQGGYLTYEMTIATAQGLVGFFGNIVNGHADFSSVSGPIGIVAFGGTFVQKGFVAIVLITASISIALAIFNVIPIPGLDGGKLLFIIVEGIIRRPISPRLATGLTVAGFVLLISLMLVVSYHDIAKLVG
ncbi:site-2 protease family protein, partial [Candidatus Parcubacteria bacterium]|nr:site-2 protease family protein [Candidatus Parcubacteria bacterium]